MQLIIRNILKYTIGLPILLILSMFYLLVWTLGFPMLVFASIIGYYEFASAQGFFIPLTWIVDIWKPIE